MQVYRPLYETASAYRNGGMFDLRPLYMFYKPAIVNGVEVRSFSNASPSSAPQHPAPNIAGFAAANRPPILGIR
jgi:hypothetical protein